MQEWWEEHQEVDAKRIEGEKVGYTKSSDLPIGGLADYVWP